ncbi:AGAP006227-PA-like protein [Anopheles sinensis]|uniref:Carboxylic ester hydrolase n=1 Tax=Anopheles sinensis TaxID=74873 RepID=A0A084WK45_ANOSI|nr:AGAP006227-PA-like protein [Anopheles sinensis]
MSSTDHPVVNTQYGPVRGVKKVAATGVEYLNFQKIPYCKPPINERRFKDLELPDPWTEPLDCTEQGPSGFQYSKLLNKIVGSEDHLYINVYTKELTPSKPRPVMLWIHGGAFMRGSSGTDMYGPDYLIQKDVVLVSFNYRIGAFGFLSFDSKDVGIPGNAGLKDQNLAIRWVRDNIASFGGNPNDVTLFGESAGGCSVHYHMVSDRSKGLFQRAIVMSGCTLNNWSIVPVRGTGERLAKALGWDGKGGEGAALQVLMKASAEDITLKQDQLLTENELENRILFAFGPVVEPYVNERTFIPKNPLEMCREAWSNEIDILIGGNSDEGLFCLNGIKENPTIMDNLGDFEYLVPLELGLVKTSHSCQRYGQRLKKFYYGETEPSFENRQGYLTLMTDKLFWHGLHRTIYSRVGQRKGAKTFVYRFAVDSETYNHYRIYFCDRNVRGTAHADDLSYLFKNVFSPVPGKDTFEYRTMQTMVELFTNFATTGNPNGGTVGDVWQPVGQTVGPYKCLNINNDGVQFVDLPETERMELWDSMYSREELY